MLRTIFVLSIAAAGVLGAFISPLYALLFYIWVAYFRPEFWVAWNPLIAQLNLSYVAGALLVLRTAASGASPIVSARVALIGLFLVQNVLSTAATPFEPQWYPLRNFAISVLVTYLIPVVVRTMREYRLVVLTIALSLGLEAAKQGWAQAIVNPGGLNANTIPFLGDNNGVGVGMLMLTPLVVALGETARSARQRWFYHFLTIGVVFRAITTYSRGAAVAAAALVGMYILRSHHRVRLIMGVGVLGVLIAMLMPPEYWQRLGTVGVSEEEMDRSASGRLHFWRVAITMANDRPFTGVGHNSYNFAYGRYDTSTGDYGQLRSVHSSWFGALAELGYTGLLLFALNVIGVIAASERTKRAVRLRAGPSDVVSFAIANEMAMVAYAVGGAFLPFQYTEMMWHLIGLSIALSRIALPSVETARERSSEYGFAPRVPTRAPTPLHDR
jgi:probable O-glycosylation ligase (exosortase A-associated)